MRYENDGFYDKQLINDALELFRDETGMLEATETTTEFIDFIVSVSLEMATGKNVLKFLRNATNLKKQNGNKYNHYQTQCILKTYSNIMTARNIKETHI